MTDKPDLEEIINGDVERGYIATFSNPPFSITEVGAKALPTEPVQIHEDPGAAYWKEATKMAEHTDRIKQMAQEAGFPSMTVDNLSQQDAERLSRFAQLVAEDCARVGDLYGMPDGASTAAIHIAEAIRARYSLATPSQAG